MTLPMDPSSPRKGEVIDKNYRQGSPNMIQKDLDEVKAIMDVNIADILQRGEKIEDLRHESHAFAASSKKSKSSGFSIGGLASNIGSPLSWFGSSDKSKSKSGSASNVKESPPPPVQNAIDKPDTINAPRAPAGTLSPSPVNTTSGSTVTRTAIPARPMAEEPQTISKISAENQRQSERRPVEHDKSRMVKEKEEILRYEEKKKQDEGRKRQEKKEDNNDRYDISLKLNVSEEYKLVNKQMDLEQELAASNGSEMKRELTGDGTVISICSSEEDGEDSSGSPRSSSDDHFSGEKDSLFGANKPSPRGPSNKSYSEDEDKQGMKRKSELRLLKKGSIGAAAPTTIVAAAPTTIVAVDPNQRPLDRFTQLQTFGGFWKLDVNLASIVGKDLSLLLSSMPTTCTQDAWATAIAICYLEKSFAAMKDEWIMLSDKARKWLKKEVKTELDNLLSAAAIILA